MYFDVYMLSAGSWKPLDSYSYNKEKVNQVICNGRSSFLASADDSGDIKIIDICQKCLYKTLELVIQACPLKPLFPFPRFCEKKNSSDTLMYNIKDMQFIPWRPWEVITGGLMQSLFYGISQKVARKRS
ncbi:unnamed protein product [Eruca vesicaria subsp. sativa]|uniref:Uncharacterized protein n=1 Tax=Eruca vesicaria subsp. sativa TaxID=29727 RepID=A0ABC8M6R5_ERUVS|nr:unnamed protein product [Eruca vesicaria subsp. sativa]